MYYFYSMSLKAYAKMILHCYKFSHFELKGIVIGSISKEIQIQDTIPLYIGIELAPTGSGADCG